jgi:DNA-binding NarL/FixJ family response regulator
LLEVLVADGSPHVRKRLSELIERLDHMHLVGVVEDGWATLEAIKELKPDLVVIDFHLSGLNGLSLIQAIKQLSCVPVILVLVLFSYPILKERCMDVGADCVFEKSLGFDHLSEALIVCADGLM